MCCDLRIFSYLHEQIACNPMLVIDDDYYNSFLLLSYFGSELFNLLKTGEIVDYPRIQSISIILV